MAREPPSWHGTRQHASPRRHRTHQRRTRIQKQRLAWRPASRPGRRHARHTQTADGGCLTLCASQRATRGCMSAPVMPGRPSSADPPARNSRPAQRTSERAVARPAALGPSGARPSHPPPESCGALLTLLVTASSLQRPAIGSRLSTCMQALAGFSFLAARPAVWFAVSLRRLRALHRLHRRDLLRCRPWYLNEKAVDPGRYFRPGSPALLLCRVCV